jgi:hypothetical protein
MHLVEFFAIDPELAARETRVMHTLVPQGKLPVGSYGLLEFYCPDPNCDCRRVMLNVAEEKRPDRFLASISYGFDRDEEDAGRFSIHSIRRAGTPRNCFNSSKRQC